MHEGGRIVVHGGGGGELVRHHWGASWDGPQEKNKELPHHSLDIVPFLYNNDLWTLKMDFSYKSNGDFST